MFTRFKLGGAVIAYSVVALVLVGGLGLALRGAYNRGEEVRSDTPLFEVDESDYETTPPPVATSEPQADTGSKKSNKSSEKTPAREPSEQLPQTGPVSGITQLLGVGLLTFSAVTYLKSRLYIRSLT